MFLAYNLVQVYFFFKLAINPLSLTNWLIVVVVRSKTSDLPILEVPDVLTTILKEKVPLSMLFKVFNLPIIHFTIRVFYFTFLNYVIVLPLPCDYFSGGKDERALTIEFVAEAVTDILIAVEEGEMSFYFNAVVIDSSESDSIVIVNLCFSIDLVVLPLSINFVAISEGFWEFFHAFTMGLESYFLVFLADVGANLVLFFEFAFVLLSFFVLHLVELFDELGLC